MNDFDYKWILERLPHRYPFLMVDSVLCIEKGVSITAVKNVTFNEPYFSGHFPGNPVMPGVLVLEAMAQAGCILALETWGNASPLWLYMTGMDSVRFRKRVRPGDRLCLEVNIIKLKKKAVKMFGRAAVNGETAAEAQFMAMAGED